MNNMIRCAIAVALLGIVGVAGAAEPAASQVAVSQQASSVSSRDSASGQATGKRQHKPVATATDADGDAASNASVRSPRDAASGQASGKRTHAPVASAGEDEDCDGDADDRVSASSRATAVAADGSAVACAQKNDPLYDDKGREVRSPLYTGNK